MRRKLVYWSPAVVCATVIFILSEQSSVSASQLIPDYLAHALEYAVFALTLVWGACAGGSNRLSLTGVMGVWAIASLYGVGDEFHQSFIPGRQASVVDVAADSVGAFLCLMIVYLVMKERWLAVDG